MIIAANWKMNDFLDGEDGFKTLLTEIQNNGGIPQGRTAIICPPDILLNTYKNLDTGNVFSFGAQDCSEHAEGAYTGEGSAKLIKNLGADYVIIGHSERREHQKEEDALIARKAQKAQEFGLTPIICVGEASADMSDGDRAAFLKSQTAQSLDAVDVAKAIIAYEPVWAIGSGLVPTPAQTQNAIHTIKSALSTDCPVLYGGSVKPANAAEIYGIENVDGVLVGGASLDVESFLKLLFT